MSVNRDARPSWTALVERDAERELIESAVAGSELGEGRVVLVYGPAGVGRSSLLRACASDAAARGIVVLQAGGDELERGYGFGIVRQLLEARIARLRPAERRSMFSDAGPAAESALGIGPSGVRVSSAGFEEIQAVHRLITGLAAVQPLLITVDDLQWCDRPSLDFLCFLGHRVARLPVTIIAAWRRGEPGVRAGRLQALAGKPDTVFLTPPPLSRHGVRAVLEREIGKDPDDDVVALVHGQTGGQPFLVSELVAGLRLRDLPARTRCLPAIAEVTPESVRRDIVARLGRHSETVQRFAQAVAVMGHASLAQAAALAAVDPDKARSIAAALTRAGILRDDSTLVYAQPLVRAAVYDTLASLECAELHHRVAGLLCDGTAGSGPADRERAVEHLLRTEPAGNPEFGKVLREVALRALEAGELADARRCLERALGEVDDVGARGEVLVSLTELDLRSGTLASAAAHAAEALSLACTPSRRVAASLASAQAVTATTGGAAAAQLLETEISRLGDSEADLELDLRAAAATLRVCTNAGPWSSQDDSAGFESLPGRTPGERAMLAACGAHTTLIGALSAARVTDICRRALADSGTSRVAHVSDSCDYLAGSTALLADGGDLVELMLGRSLDQAGSAAIDDGEPGRLALRAQLALARGELSAADAHARAALDLLRGRSLTALPRRLHVDLLATLVVIGIERSRCDAAEQALAELTAAPDAPKVVVETLRMALALAQSASRRALASAAAVAQEPIGIAPPGISWRPWAALAYHAAGDAPTAVALATEHLDHGHGWGAPPLHGRALLIRGIVDPGPRRLSLIKAAVAVLECTPARLELARASIELGAALRRARRPREARAALVRGSDLAHACGADALSARARSELLSVGARPRRAAFSGVSSLTFSELRVARLAAAGMTNRQIAHELTVSAKTVSGQLAAVYRKLDVHDRAALAAAMESGGEIDRPLAQRKPELVN